MGSTTQVYQQDYDTYQDNIPCDPAAEQAVLGCMLLKKTAINDAVGIISGHCFRNPAHETIFNMIVTMDQAGLPTDPQAVAHQLTKTGVRLHEVGGMTYLATLMHNAPAAASAGYHADVVLRYAKMRAIQETATRLAQMVKETNLDDVDRISDIAAEQLALMGSRFASTSSKPKFSKMGTTMRRTRWLWVNHIAMGSLSLLAGLRDIGKTSLLCKIAADATHGRWEGEFYGTPVDVLYIFTEDSEGMTITPRLKAAGANMDRIYKWGSDDNTEKTSFMLSQHMGDLEKFLTENPQVKLVIIDPLSGVLTANQRGNGGAEMREALQEAARMADRLGVSILGNSHFRKANDADVLNRITGSSELVNVVRTVLAASVYETDEYDEKTCVLSVEKNNLGLSTGLDGDLYQFREVKGVGRDELDGTPVDAIRVEFLGKTSMTVSKISAAQASGESTGVAAECESMLAALLVNSPDGLLREEAEAWRKKQGFTAYALTTAVKTLKAKKLLFSVPTGNGAERKYSAVPAPEKPAVALVKPVPAPAPVVVPEPVYVPQEAVVVQLPVAPQTTDCASCGWPVDSDGHAVSCGGVRGGLVGAVTS